MWHYRGINIYIFQVYLCFNYSVSGLFVFRNEQGFASWLKTFIRKHRESSDGDVATVNLTAGPNVIELHKKSDTAHHEKATRITIVCCMVSVLPLINVRNPTKVICE